MALLLVACVYVALFFYFLDATVITQPYWDMFSIITRYLQYQRDGNLWSYLWEPHVQHRHIWMRLLTALDARVFSGVGYPFVIVAAACQMTTAWLVWRVVQQNIRGDQQRWLGCLAVMLVLTSVAAVDCAIPMNGIYPQTLLLSVLAIVLFDRPAAIDGSGKPWPRVLALCAAMGAAFGNAVALGLWPILLWLAWKTRAGRAWLAAILLVGGAFSAMYLIGIPGVAVSASGAAPLSEGVARAADYLVTYLGLPWTRSAALLVPGRILGAAFLVAGVFVGAWGLARPVRSPLDRIALCFIAFSLGTAVLAAFGRSGIDADLRVPVRYSVFLAPLHIGLLMFAWPRLASMLEAAGRSRLLYSAAVAAAVALVAQQLVSGRAAVATTESMRATLQRFDAGEETEDMKSVVYVDLRQARRDLNAIHDAGLYRRVR